MTRPEAIRAALIEVVHLERRGHVLAWCKDEGVAPAAIDPSEAVRGHLRPRKVPPVLHRAIRLETGLGAVARADAEGILTTDEEAGRMLAELDITRAEWAAFETGALCGPGWVL